MRRTSIALLALLALPAASEERDDLDEIVVEAEAPSGVSPGIPGSTTIIGPEEIAASGVRSVAELLASKPGLRVTSTSGERAGGQVHLRGFGANASSRVLVLVDGRPSNRPDMSGISWLEVPLSGIERVEIFRGASTARFGDHAVGGVIHLVTKKGGSPETSVEAAGGSDGYRMARLNHRERDFSFGFERNFTDGWRDNAASEMEAAFFRWDRDFKAGGRAELGLAWSDEFSGFPGPLTEEMYRRDPRRTIYFQPEQYFNRQRSLRGDAGLGIELGKKTRLEVPLWWSSRDLEWNFGAGSHADNRLTTFGAKPEVRWTSEKTEFAAGMEVLHEELDIVRFAEIGRETPVGTADLTRTLAGVFANAETGPWNDWRFTAAARWARAEVEASSRDLLFPGDPWLNFSRSSSESQAALELGLRWEPLDDFSAWLRYDRLYRLPSTDEIAAYQGYPMSEPFNADLEAETGHGLEVGGEWSPGPWSLKLGAFAQWLEGEIAHDFTRNLNVNLADTRRMGLEGELGWSSGIWEAELHATWLSARFRDGPYQGNDVFLVPRFEAGAVLACRPREDLSFRIEYRFTGSSYEGDDFANVRPKLPSYGVADFMVRYEPQPGLTVYARVNNLFDERYATVKYHGLWYPAAGRQFVFGIRREF